MCTLAGYIGSKPAAPILLEMSKKQEGLWAGYYAGLGTLAKGKLHYEKLVGDTRKLEALTKAASLPGTTGLVHSRTKSGGDREWGHPFVDSSETVACVAQGHTGIFSDNERRKSLGNELLDAGLSFKSAVEGEIEGLPMLSDGTSCHATELFCVAVSHAYSQSGDPIQAMWETLRAIPAEAIYLMIFKDHPDKIFVANVNQRLALARDDSGTYLATSSLAFPEHITDWSGLPPDSMGIISKETLEVISHTPSEELMVDETIPPGLEDAFLSAVTSDPGNPLGVIMKQAFSDLYPEDSLVCMAPTAYQTMESLLIQGKIRLETHPVPGVDETDTAPQTIFLPAEEQ